VTEQLGRDWELLSEETAYRRRFHVVSRRYRLPSGVESDFDILVAPEVVSVLCLTEGDGHVVLARQYRPGPAGWIDELPGGGVDPGEAHADAAPRELLEETGYAGAMQYVGSTLQAANSTMVKHVYACTAARRVADPANDDVEVIEPLVVPMAAFRARLRGGQLTDVAAGYMALDALGLL